MKQEEIDEPAEKGRASEGNRQSAGEVAELKAATIRHGRLTAWVLGGAFLACVGVGLALWSVEPARGPDNDHFGFAFGAAAMIFWLVALGGAVSVSEA